ncbi:MAG: hypothetical protein GY910_22010 [bacterium]|nr:hypothetical protein [Deltaproteobacteria bacterium]MCP4907655.1 hypothetical protein [bacterium]
MQSSADRNDNKLASWLSFTYPFIMLAILAVNAYAFSVYQSGAKSPGYGPLRLSEGARRDDRHRVSSRYAFYYALQDQLRGAELSVPRGPGFTPERLIAIRHLGLVDPVAEPVLLIEQARLAKRLPSMRLYRQGFIARTGIDAAALDRIEHKQMARRHALRKRARAAEPSPSDQAPHPAAHSKHPMSLWLPEGPTERRGQRFVMALLGPHEGASRPSRFVVLSEEEIAQHAGWIH